MNKTKIFTLVSLVSILIVLIVFVCFEKFNDIDKDVVISTHQKSEIKQSSDNEVTVKPIQSEQERLETQLAKLEQKNQQLSDKLGLKYNKPSNTYNKDKSHTKYFVCVDNTGKHYDLILSNTKINNYPVTSIIFNFKSQSKHSAKASDSYITINIDGIELRKLSAITRVNWIDIGIAEQFSDNFYYDDEVEYYFTVKQFKLSDNSWHKISIIRDLDFYNTHPIHNDKSNCALVPDNLPPTAILKRNNII